MGPASLLPETIDSGTLTFSVGEARLGLAASLVREVVSLPPLARVPHAPDVLMGVANIRGTVVPVLSIARLLGQDASTPQRVIVADIDGPLGLAVNDVAQVTTGNDSAVTHLDVANLIARAVPERRARSARAPLVMAVQAQNTQTEAVALVAFAASGQDFALALSSVEHVLRLPADIAQMPHAERAVVGSVALQNTVLPLLSLSALLALPVAAPTSRSRVVVVSIGAHRVGIVVDAVRGVERVAESEIDAVPHVLNRGGGEARILAVCRLDGGTRLLSVLAPDQLLDEATTARLLLGNRGDTHEMAGENIATAHERFLLFTISNESFGLPITSVQEVTSLPPRLTPLPKAPDFVLGVMNVRGQVIPVIDQSRRFTGVPVEGAKPRVIVAQVGELTAGFVVDAVSDVVQVSAEALHDAPDFGRQRTRVFERVASIAGQDTLVLIVSPQELLDRAEQDLLLVLGKKSAKTKA